MELEGTVKAIHGIKVISEKFKVCDLWIDTIEDYPQEHTIQLTNDRTQYAHDNLKEGDRVKLNINLKGREYDKKDGTKGRFSSIEAWKIEVLKDTEPVEDNVNVSTNSVIEEGDDDSLPF